MKIYNVKWNTKTAGPSPDNNERVELFLFGCNRAKEGNACKGCFNYNLWDDSIVEYQHSPEDIAGNIIKHSPNKYISISGGEPFDQKEDLARLVKILKSEGFNILVYSWRKIEDLIHLEDKDVDTILDNIDILIDDEYVEEENMYKEDSDDGMFSSVGSGNQTIWDMNNNIGYKLNECDALFMKENSELLYVLKDINTPEKELKKFKRAC